MSKSKTSRLGYQEGDFFAIPLEGGGYAVGIVARSGPKGKVLFGYFFGPKCDAVPSLDDVLRYKPSDAILVGQFGDLGLYKREWPVIGHADTWDRSAWPMPDFARIDSLSGRARCVTYADDDPNQIVRDVPCSSEEAASLPSEALMGAGAVRTRLTRLLSDAK